MTGLERDRANEGRVELQAKAEVRPLLRRLEDVTHEGQFGCDEKVVIRIVLEALVTEKYLLAALSNHAKDRVVHAVKRLPGRGGAVEIKSFERLNRPILADGSCDPLDQLFPAGLRPACLTLYLLEGRRIHVDFFSLSCTSI
jgi:hypothetical protein